MSACIEWTGNRHTRGYGIAAVGKQRVLAHRLAMEMTYGPVTDGYVVCHRCDNPPCVNVEHLFLGTQADNLADMRAKGRGSKPPLHLGARHPLSKMTEADVRVARARHANGESMNSLARAFGIAGSTMRAIIHRETWRHVEEPFEEPEAVA